MSQTLEKVASKEPRPCGFNPLSPFRSAARKDSQYIFSRSDRLLASLDGHPVPQANYAIALETS